LSDLLLGLEPLGRNRMPIFLMQTRKATQLYGGRKWSNQYFTIADDPEAALAFAQSIWLSIEKPFHYDDCYCYEVYVNEQGDTPFSIGFTDSILAVDAFGDLASSGAGQKAPTFVVARVDFPVFNSRPSRKFYRAPLRETDFDGDTIGAGYVTALGTGLSLLASVGDFCDNDGQAWLNSFTVRGITSRRLGKTSAVDVPSPPS